MKWLEVSSSRYVHSDSAPALLIYADGDEPWRREQNQEIAAALKRTSHADVSVKEVKDRDHSTIFSQIDKGDEVSTLMLDFIT